MKTEKDRDRLGRFVKNYKRSRESCKNQGVVLRGKYASGEIVAWHKGKKGVRIGVEKGNIPWNKGLGMEDPRVKNNVMGMAETRKKQGYISEELRKKIEKGTNTPEFKQLVSERRAKQKFPFRDTIIERTMEKAFRVVGLKFKKHVPLKVKNGYHQVDFLLKNKIVVECDGEYWHKRLVSKMRDDVIDHYITKQGYVILRFWGNDILKKTTKCIKIIIKAIRNPESVTTIRQTFIYKKNRDDKDIV